MSKFAQVGDFCPNKACADYGKRQGEQQHNIIRFDKTKAGRQRFKCKTCGGTFTETKGTILYRRHTPESEIIQTLAFLAWIRDAAEHAAAVEEVLLAEYQIERGQLGGLWAYVRNKGEKKATPRPTKAASSGGPR